MFSLCRSAPDPGFSCLCREGDAGAAIVAAGNRFRALGRVEGLVLPASGGSAAYLWAFTEERLCRDRAVYLLWPANVAGQWHTALSLRDGHPSLTISSQPHNLIPATVQSCIWGETVQAQDIPVVRLSAALPDSSLIAGEVPAWVWTRCRDIWDHITEALWKFKSPLAVAPTKCGSITSRCELFHVYPREDCMGSRHRHCLRRRNFQSMNLSAPKADVSKRAGEKCYKYACFSQWLQKEARQLAQTQMSELK